MLKESLQYLTLTLYCIVAVGAHADKGLRELTTQTNIGLFYMPGAPEIEKLWREGDDGERLFLEGRVLTPEGKPIQNALVELWHADTAGGVDESRYRTAARNHPIYGPRHIHVVVSHPEHERLVSLIFFKGDELLPGSPYPELAIALEEASSGAGELFIGSVELVLGPQR